jgi:phosphate transport system permease protein
MYSLLKPEQNQSFVVYLCAMCAGVLMLAFIALVGYIVLRGSGFFWPNPIYSLTYEVVDGETQSAYAQMRSQYTKERGGWLSISSSTSPYQTQIILGADKIKSIEKSADVAEVKLLDGRSMLAVPREVATANSQSEDIDTLSTNLEKVQQIESQLSVLRDGELSEIHRQLAEFDRRGVAEDAPARERLLNEYALWQVQIGKLETERDQYALQLLSIDKQQFSIPLSLIQGVTFPTDMSLLQKIGYSMTAFGYFLSDSPKQANTAGGIFPALFGTVIMVLLMTLIVAPFGVLAAIYLHEYAPNNILTSTIRVCISNMAAVPSIVYGVFGLGFLVYVVGGSIDELFFSDVAPSPVLGTPGIFWAAVTMALLTLPVVVVATEEGLSRVPQGLRRGSYALGATKSETIRHTVLPIASPSIMTGIILAIARAAGEVAPLMLVGAVRFAPNLPIDSEFPFLHLDRQFMHLGVLIYDGAFYSQTSPRGASMMFATCSLLLLVVLILNIVAMVLRARLRERFHE